MEKLYAGALLRAVLADWEIIALREYENVIGKGSGHAGRSAPIDLLARKPVTGK